VILAGNTYRAFELAPKFLAGIVNSTAPASKSGKNIRTKAVPAHGSIAGMPEIVGAFSRTELRLIIWLSVLAVIALLARPTFAQIPEPSDADWTTHNRTLQGDRYRYSPLKEITTANVKNLKPVATLLQKRGGCAPLSRSIDS
jgi:fatty acid desaturase